MTERWTPEDWIAAVTILALESMAWFGVWWGVFLEVTR
jgi:hypothetical protein